MGRSDYLKNKENQALVCLCGMFLFYVIWFFSWCALKFYFFGYDDFDLGIHDQIIWNILHGRIFNSILGVDFLGNHAHFISFLVAPFYFFFPHPLFLLFLQTVFLAAGVFPLYAIARLYLGRRMSLITGAIYLLYPGLGFTNLYEFHPTCFAVFFLLCAAYYFYRENFYSFSIFMVLSLLCQENIALIFIMWGVYALFLKRRLEWVLWPACAGLIYFLLCVYVILPGFNKNTFNFFHIYGPLGDSLSGVLQTCFLHPVKVMALVFQPQKIHYIFLLFISVFFVPFFAPLALLPVFLIFLQHLLSARPSEVSLHYHYTAELIPFIFTAFVFGIKKISILESKYRSLGVLLLFNALMANMLLGPHFHLMQEWKRLISDDSVVQKVNFLEQVPKDASVVSTFEFLPHLSHRQELYSFHHVYSGFYTLFTKPYHLPDGVQYALIDFNDYLTFVGFYNPDNYRNIDDFLKQGPWGTVDVLNGIVLFKKGVKDKYPLFNFISGRGPVPHPLDLTIDKRIELYGYDAGVRSGRIHLIFYWKLLRIEQKDVNIFIDFIDQNGNVMDRQFQPLCYRIWPTQAWQKNQSIEEHQYISFFPKFKRRIMGLKVGFYDYRTKMLIPTDSKDALGRIDLKLTEQ
jgi:uncharacterized membrane protein